MEVLLCQPFFLFRRFRDVDPFDLEDDRTGAVITAGDHHSVVIGPAFHDGAALKGSVNIAADRIPGFAAELAVHQVIEIILLRRALEYKGIARMEDYLE